jgi:putative hemolysin
MMVEDGVGGPLVSTFRMRTTTAAEIMSGYASQFYDLARLSQTHGPHIEIGRFCTDPANPDPHIPRVAWGALTQIVDASEAQVLFGCTSFEGTDPTLYGRHWQRLADNHLGPVDLLPGQKSPDAVPFDRVDGPGHRTPMPPLLRTYLAMGGWVSDHAVVDHVMNTMHVLTVVEIAKIPPARVKALRALV